jgi:hypothetical protein
MAFIFRSEKYAEQETSVKEGGKLPPKRRLTLNGLYGLISQTMVLFKIRIISYLVKGM